MVVSTDDPASLIQNFLVQDELTVRIAGPEGSPSRFLPKYYPRARRYLHLDLAFKGDSLGIAMGCRSHTVQIERIDNNVGIKVVEQAPFIHIDFMLRVKPPMGGSQEIDFGKVRSFILYLNQLGFSLDLSFDSFQSKDTQQIMEKQGFHGEIVSVDRDDSAYLALRSAIMEERVDYYEYTPFIEEVSSVLWDFEKRKVDHPEGGSKDVSDCVAAIVARISEEAGIVPSYEQILPGTSFFGGSAVEPTPAGAPKKPTTPEEKDKQWVISDYNPDA